ncbi:hypothetical protein CFB50_33155 [Burkholderia sp. AU33423]|uniref:DUF4238 domain-containing protein n=1 Tax=Burkholderia TaxID=32008 RepID=UPI0009F3836F|nr:MULTISPECIES: DUF4238 domain-containing protein [Burkholderia]OXI80022.1 hypothetical protein CFB50_33155 [Burkholderia sp. AU33423]OXJ32364.1 hypothetical protein CFB82_18335 [Burkholderia sp. HI2714]
MNTPPPKNHHYVPQHFLKAWATPSTGEKLYRYRVIEHTGQLECRQAAIRKSASEDHLYELHFPDGSFEIESLVVTPILDEMGHKILARIRETPFQGLSQEQKKELAIYLACLEARHPETLKKMDISGDLEQMRQKMKVEVEPDVSRHSIDEVFDYVGASPSTGVMAFALFVRNERSGALARPFSDGLLEAEAIEYQFPEDCLLTSDFPCFRLGEYLGDALLYVVAISPRKSLIYSRKTNATALRQLPQQVRAELINFYSLGFAQKAFSSNDKHSAFVKSHLGWARRHTTTEARQRYLQHFLEDLFARHSIK